MNSLRALIVLIAFVGGASAATFNGNDFALSYAEAKTPVAKKQVLDAAIGQQAFFRYLQIMEMKTVSQDGQDAVSITAFEPGSYYDVKFTVTMPVSLSILREDPPSKVGDAIAVTARVTGIEPGKNIFLLDSPIVRHKDRLSPKIGQELLGEVKPGSTFYSYTEGPRPINLEYRDRDLLANRDAIMAQGGSKAWFEYLEREVNKRKAQRAAESKGGAQH